MISDFFLKEDVLKEIHYLSCNNVKQSRLCEFGKLYFIVHLKTSSLSLKCFVQSYLTEAQ